MSVEAGGQLSHYRLIEKVGEGGSGVVWRALDQELEREVALKLLSDALSDDPRLLARFEREAKAIAALNHPNIVTVHAVGEDGGHRFISMELIRGRALSELVVAGGLPFKQLIDLAVPMTEAIAAVHAAGIAHGDLKPGNVMVTDRGAVKILDFGLARGGRPGPVAVSPDSETRTLSIEGHVSGTVRYMSPEQVQGKTLDPRSDIFALGILISEMATGRRPFDGDTSADVIASVLKDPPPAPSRLNREMPRHLDRILERCLDKRPEHRPSATELLEELRSLASAPAAGRIRTDLSIAVLPFVDMSPERDQDYFCEGMSDEIINAISHVADLRVASRTSSFRFKKTPLDSREIGDRLGVENLLEGSVRKSGEHLRISVRLIDVANDYQLWAERYDRQLEDVFAIQEEIAQSIVEAQVATADVRAYDFHLRGRRQFRQFRRKSIEFARQMFARAIAIDPNYAGAWAGLADCCSYLCMFWEATAENLREADEASRKAVELDPELPEAYVARGVAISLGDRHEEAAKEFETAIRLNPNLWEAYYFCARGHYARGNLAQAVRWFERAIAARPEDYQAYSLLGSALAGLGRKADSDTAYRASVERAQAQLELNPGEARALYFSAIALCQLGEREQQSIEWAERALALDPNEPQVLYNVGCVFALLGRADRALEYLARTIEHGSWWKTWMSNDPDLVSLENDPRFRALVG